MSVSNLLSDLDERAALCVAMRWNAFQEAQSGIITDNCSLVSGWLHYCGSLRLPACIDDEFVRGFDSRKTWVRFRNACAAQDGLLKSLQDAPKLNNRLLRYLETIKWLSEFDVSEHEVVLKVHTLWASNRIVYVEMAKRQRHPFDIFIELPEAT